MNKEIGKVTRKIIDILNLIEKEEKIIFIGDSNIKHIKNEHPKDFEKYGDDIEGILSNPTYLARNEKKNSIEFIKEYKIDNDFVLVAIRVSGKGTYFVRTMYVMAFEKVERYFKHNYFIKVEKNKKYAIIKLA